MPVFLCLFEISWQSNNCFSFLAKIISPATRKKRKLKLILEFVGLVEVDAN